MKLYFAPLEGITDYTFRMLHHQYYGGVDRYYIPFLSPTMHHRLPPKEQREVALEHNLGQHAVPQLLTKNAEDFNWAASELWDMGYQEVNLNLGCPSGTVVPKGKGAGFLAWPDRLDAFLEEIFRYPAGAISIKTRLGMHTPEEFGQLLEIYRKYPICELTIHPRTRDEQYTGPLHPEAFEMAAQRCPFPICYNGELRTVAQISALQAHNPALPAAMVGRALVARPALALHCRGKQPPQGTRAEYHRALCQTYLERFGAQKPALMRMKQIWQFWMWDCPDGERQWKKLRKEENWSAFCAKAQALLGDWDWDAPEFAQQEA